MYKSFIFAYYFYWDIIKNLRLKPCCTDYKGKAVFSRVSENALPQVRTFSTEH